MYTLKYTVDGWAWEVIETRGDFTMPVHKSESGLDCLTCDQKLASTVLYVPESGIDCLICGLDCLICAKSVLDCLMCAEFAGHRYSPRYTVDGWAWEVIETRGDFTMPVPLPSEKIFIELMTSDRKLKASREGSK